MSIVSDHVPSSAPSTPTLESSSHAELLEQLKTQVPEALFAMVSGRLNAYAHELAYSKLKIQVLEERLRLQRIEKYGPSSEKLSNLQLELLEQEPGVSREEVVAESERKAPPPATERKKRQASRTSDSARRSSPRGAGDCLHSGAVRMRQLRPRTPP